MKVIVLHEGYGCDTGCCGHVIYIDGKRSGEFDFYHPGSRDDFRKWAEDCIERQFPGHSQYLDWDSCEVVND